MTPSTTLIAILDDEEPVRRALRRLLNSVGYDVDIFPTGEALLASLPTRRPACLVLDLHMPQTDGFAVLSRLRNAHDRLPVVVITGHDTPESRQRVMDAGVVWYLRKPIDDQQLINAIAEALAHA